MATEYEKLCKYIKNLTVTQGSGSGEKFRLLPWQRKFLKGFLENQVSALSIARSNGKSTLLAAVACAALDGPLSRENAECLVVSGAFNQARIIFDRALSFLPDKSKYRIWDSGMRAEIRNEETGSSILCSASTPRLLHGRQNSLILVDEPQSIQGTQAEKIISALLTSLGKIDGARICFLGTRPFTPDHWFQGLLDDVADFSMSFCPPTELITKKPFNLKTIRMANPSYDYFPQLRVSIKKGIERAKKDEAFLQHHLSLVLNGGVDDTVENLLIQASTWENAEGDAPADGPCIFGVDLGQDYSMSAVAAFWPETGRLESFSAFPSTPALETRAQKDGMGSLYSRLNRQGELLLLGQFSVDYDELIRTAVERWGKPCRVVCDSWRRADLLQAMLGTGIDCPVELRRWGPIDGSEEVRVFQRGVVDGKVTPKRSLLLRSSMSRVRVKADGRNNWVIEKRRGDDPALASVLAISSGIRIPPENVDEDYKIEAFTL